MPYPHAAHASPRLAACPGPRLPSVPSDSVTASRRRRGRFADSAAGASLTVPVGAAARRAAGRGPAAGRSATLRVQVRRSPVNGDAEVDVK